jgi:indolepyruvate ferredoxin oxidoreductase alpha subunit
MYALKTAMKRSRVKPFIVGDIGCYTLMCYPPHHLGDAKFSMGASIGVASGYSQTLNEKTVAVIGDSTFIHAGIPGLINCIYNGSDILVIICDNSTTGMTGGQPHAGTGITATGNKTRRLDLEALIRGCGVEDVEVVDPYEIRQTIAAIRKGLKQKGVCVVISRRACALQAFRKSEVPVFRVDPEACNQCWSCIEKLACPALFRQEGENETVCIDSIQCTGCGMCAQICPSSAISSSI